MGNFTDAPIRSRLDLPDDLPKASEAERDGRPAGAAFRSDDGNLYRLVHATWRMDVRDKQARDAAAAKAKPAGK